VRGGAGALPEFGTWLIDLERTSGASGDLRLAGGEGAEVAPSAAKIRPASRIGEKWLGESDPADEVARLVLGRAQDETLVMFSVDQRERLRDHIFEMAKEDRRVVGGAILGSLAHDNGDEWSDLDLMFAVADGVPVAEVLEGWSQKLISDVGAVPLFDLPSGSIIYRVLLLPDCLELDLSFVPASEFGSEGMTFELVFGTAIEQPEDEATPAAEVFGYAVHHALHARFAIERRRYWQAEHWISAVRDKALHLACLRRGLDGWYGRDFDRLPAEVLALIREGLVRSLDAEELRRALEVVVAALLRESTEVSDMAAKLEGQLYELASLQAGT
jgi:hypothetical protein